MAKIHRYGDEGTVVTLREKAIAVLFIVGIAALLVGREVATPAERPGTTVAHARSATPAPNQNNASGNGPADASSARARATATGQD